ncbi:MAG: type 4a pilus biogenesis protein PilO [Acidobacteriia bacterium]|nr:type 4a pilus biogenesis protein PilO [Terriglobia bacterium]
MAQRKRKSFHWWLLGAGGGLLVLDLLFYFTVLAPARRVYGSREAEHQNVVKTLTERKKDVARLEAIQAHLKNATGGESVRFQQYLWSVDDGFSALIQFLNDTTKQAGVRKDRTSFKSSEEAGSGLLEVQVGLPVEGTYTDIVKFINSLQRGNHVLIIDSIGLRSGQDNPNLVRLDLSMLTYMRTI